MRFRTHAFLICFVPLAILLASSSWIMQQIVQSTVRAGVRGSMRENQLALDRLQSRSDLQSNRFLRVVGENAALKAGMELLASEKQDAGARRTVEDQLLELGEHMGFDYLVVSAPDGTPLAGVIRTTPQAQGAGDQLVPITTLPRAAGKGLSGVDGQTFQIAVVPIDANSENVGSLTVGERFDLSAFATPAVLLHHGAVVMSNLTNSPVADIEAAMKRCTGAAECEVRLQHEDWISLPISAFTEGNEYILRNMENLDVAMAPLQSRLRGVFWVLALLSVAIIFACSVASSRSIVRPIADLVAHMRLAVNTGVLPEYDKKSTTILEVLELAKSYNRAATSVRRSHDSLQRAYVEFVGSLANALDARDQYTAGHSLRVSQVSCAIAARMRLSPDLIERIRIGALLHDIGKIGVADCLLQKTERLTDEEFTIICEHPVIGRRILEGVQGFAPFLPAVELHHENWNGTGYPHGWSGEQVPVEARIIHIADAYDAMTTNRSYRVGMTHEKAIRVIAANAGTQFDPHIAELFATMPFTLLTAQVTSGSFVMSNERRTAALA